MLGHALRQQSAISRATGRVFGRQFAVDQSLGAGATFTRAGTATKIFPASWGVTSVDETAGNNIARFTAGGVLLEPASKNCANTSDALASPATRTLDVTGAFTLWVSGTASVTVAAGTAIGTGWGTATVGNPVTLTITGAGTVTLTLNSGSFNQAQDGSYIYQLESLAVPSSFIPNTDASTTRAVDSDILYSLTTPQTEGMAVIECTFPSGLVAANQVLMSFRPGWSSNVLRIVSNFSIDTFTTSQSANVVNAVSASTRSLIAASLWKQGGELRVLSIADGTTKTAALTGVLSSVFQSTNQLSVGNLPEPIIIKSVSIYSVDKGQAWLQERFK